MICPIMSNTVVSAEPGHYGVKDDIISTPLVDCLKERCAWWVEQKEYVPVDSTLDSAMTFKDTSCCVIKLIAEKNNGK